MTTLFILNGRGDTRLTWDHADPAQVEEARKTVADLKSQGYQFFLVDGSPADEVMAGAGALVVRKLTAEEITEPAIEPETTPDESPAPEPLRRGRSRKEQSVVAVRPMAGG